MNNLILTFKILLYTHNKVQLQIHEVPEILGSSGTLKYVKSWKCIGQLRWRLPQRFVRFRRKWQIQHWALRLYHTKNQFLVGKLQSNANSERQLVCARDNVWNMDYLLDLRVIKYEWCYLVILILSLNLFNKYRIVVFMEDKFWIRSPRNSVE